MVRNCKRHTVLYDTDKVAKVTWLSLLRDFRRTEGNLFAHQAETAFLSGMDSFREYEFPELGDISPGRYKRWKQLSSCLKKYRFENDAFDDDTLYNNTAMKFFREQERISVAQQPTPLCYEVLQRARKIAGGILGSYDPEYTLMNSRFGKKSSIGCPLSLAYIDNKLSMLRAFTGSTECSKWFFEDYLPGDPILKELVSTLLDSHNFDSQFLQRKPHLAHNSLNLVLVPKSWKVLRPITPLTLLALFYSYGVGEQVTSCLKDAGLDIRRLQQRHRRLVQTFSLTRSHATADLSSASDSLTSELLNRVLPREWYCAVKKTFSHQLLLDGKIHYTASVLPMGNGLTFPIETLVFYSILQAISELSEIRGIVSVYGDDLIYPSRLHKFVSHIFPRIGLVLNLDKTFVKAHFRESCGSDFYHGIDVRPFQFGSDGHQRLSRTNYRAFLYKTVNGLLRRWAAEEIPETIKWLLAELSMVTESLFRVPPSFPDTAGIKVEHPMEIPLGTHFLTWSPIDYFYVDGSRWFHFSFLIEVPDKRFITCILPYYWLALQGRDDIPKDSNFWNTDYSVFAKERPYSPIGNQPSMISWDVLKAKKWSQLKNGKRFCVVEKTITSSVTARTGSKTVVKKTRPGSISDWI